jgi:hypothetical protein
MRIKYLTHALLITAVIGLGRATAVSAAKSINAPIKKVTVYLDRAKVTRITELNLNKGEVTVELDSLPVSLVESSIRAYFSDGSGVKILGLSHKLVTTEIAPQQRVAELNQQISQFEDVEKRALRDRLDAFNGQKALLMAVTKTAGDKMSEQTSKGGLEVGQWEAAFRFIGARLLEVGDSIRVSEAKIAELDRKLERLHNDLSLLAGAQQNATRSVQVDLRAAQDTKVSLAFDYIIPNAWWVPIYDARLISESDSLELNYNAEVRQQTGEDWNQVELTLSTAAPQLQAGPGDLQPWQLAVCEPQPVPRPVREEFAQKTDADERLRNVAGVKTTASGEVFIRGGRAGEVGYIVDGVPVNEPQEGQFAQNHSLLSNVSSSSFQTSFVVQRPESIPSGEKSVRTSIAQYRLSQKTQLISRPRLLDGAFRQVSITNQSQAPIMPGSFSLFADADFIGNATVSTLVVPDQSFDLPFGIDNSMKVERKILNYKRNQSGDKTKIDQTVSIKLWNRGKTVRAVNLEEPLPLSQDTRVKITWGEILPKPATTDAVGKAAWTLTINPGDSAILSIPYRIEYPSGVTVTGM